MWDCSDIKEGYLTGNFKELFIKLSRRLFGKIAEFDDYSTSNPYFDSMEKREKLFAIQYVASRLVSPDVEAPDNRAWSDATIFSILADGREEELELIMKSCHDFDLEVEMGDNDCFNLAFLILWDSDWDFSSMVMDLHPVGYDIFTSIMGIEKDYYIDSHPDVVGSAEEWESIVEGLK